ncbi:MAG: hypothetical protein GY778_11905, partial [bacterium]|nr:hypothetical protein [bacterium]
MYVKADLTGPPIPTAVPLLAAAGPGDTDGDGVLDASDNCPTIANGPAEDNQADSDNDLVGDACDNCTLKANPSGVPPFGVRTSTGGQLDDDADGYGNVCDGKFTVGFIVSGSDTQQFKTALTGKRVTDSTCGTSGLEPCDRYDVDEQGLIITGNDTFVYKQQLAAFLVGPKCAACGPPYP